MKKSRINLSRITTSGNFIPEIDGLRLITNIGGMCYTIYLLHFAIISFVSNPILSIQFSDNPIINIGLYSITILSIILVVSMVFFVLIERSCMDKNWTTKFLNSVFGKRRIDEKKI